MFPKGWILLILVILHHRKIEKNTPLQVEQGQQVPAPTAAGTAFSSYILNFPLTVSVVLVPLFKWERVNHCQQSVQYLNWI